MNSLRARAPSSPGPSSEGRFCKDKDTGGRETTNWKGAIPVERCIWQLSHAMATIARYTGYLVGDRGRELISVSLVFGDEATQRLEGSAVEPLRLAICLGMVGCSEQLPDPQDSRDAHKEPRGKL